MCNNFKVGDLVKFSFCYTPNDIIELAGRIEQVDEYVAFDTDLLLAFTFKGKAMHVWRSHLDVKPIPLDETLKE